MNKAEQFHKNLQSRKGQLERLAVAEKATVAERYELSIIDALDEFYDDEEDMRNMAIAMESLVQGIFKPFMPEHETNS